VERDAASNAITKRYFAQGVQLNGQGLYYALDNLGSVRELINSSGAVTTHFDYDPYGVRRVLAGSVNSDFGFAGLFHESSSGLDLALYRSYDARRRRWLNRDPMGDGAGLNLYTYAANNPFTLLDPSGLWSWDSAWGFGASVGEGIVAGAVTAFVGAGVAAITPAWAAGTVAAGATLAAGYGLLNLARAIRSAWTGCENGRALDDYERGERLGQSFLGVATAGIFLRTLNAFNGASRDLFNLRTKGFFARLAADSQANTVASSVYNSGRAVTWRDWAIFRPRSWFAKGDDATYRATVKTGGTLLGRLGAIFFFGGSQSGNDPASLGRPSRVAY
jgi:RHS repeat-associated protein